MKHKTTVHQGPPRPFLERLMEATGLTRDDCLTIIRMGGAYLGKYRCKEPDKMVRSGQEISAYYRFPLVMEETPFCREWVVHEDRLILVADKPAGIPTQGARNADYDCFHERLKRELKGYVGLHHRLDRDTSGLMLFTRDKSANKDAARFFSERLIQKTYLALVGLDEKGPPPQTFTVKKPLVGRKIGGVVKQVVDGGGKPAETRYRTLAVFDDRALVAAKPITGRTHQIRVHLAHLGFPLVGDVFYGGRSAPRFMLHCARLVWPRSGPVSSGDFYQAPPEDWALSLPGGFQFEAFAQELKALDIDS